MKSSILIVLVLIVAWFSAQAAHGQSEQGTRIILNADIDSLTLYVAPGQNANLMGLAFESILTSRGSVPLALYEAFRLLPLDDLPVPLCFRLIRVGENPVLPLICQNIQVISQEVTSSDVFWYSDNLGGENLLPITIRGGEHDLLCVHNQQGCELTFTPNTLITPTPIPTAAMIVPPTPETGAIDCSIGDINIEGSPGASITNCLFFPGDSPEVVAQKLLQQRRVISDQIFSEIQDVDTRLNLALVVLQADDFNPDLESLRATIAPAASQIFESDYDQLILEQKIAQLQNIFGANQLNMEPSSALMEYVAQSGLSPDDIRFFYQQLAEVQSISDNILVQLDTLVEAIENGDGQEWLDYQHDSLQNEIYTLINRSNFAYLFAQKIFASIVDLQPELAAEIPLGRLQVLTPTHLMSLPEIGFALSEVTDESAALSEQRENLYEQGRSLLKGDLVPDDDINLDVTPDDTWDVVVAKAISLRQLGRTSEALNAFAQYKAMFSADPTAEQYADTAHWFTVQAEALEVIWHGVYIYEVQSGSAADEAGLLVGDILVEYDGQALTGIIHAEGTDGISGMQYMEQVLAGDLTGDVEVTYFRLQPDKTFARQTASLSLNGSIGIGMMPI